MVSAEVQEHQPELARGLGCLSVCYKINYTMSGAQNSQKGRLRK